MKTFYADTTNDMTYEVKAESEEEAKQQLINYGEKPIRIVPKKGNHICEYCGHIALGHDKDLLCERCRELFGHYFFSEL